MSFQFKSLEIPGPVLVEPAVFRDPRGFFAEIYRASDFVSGGIPKPFVQMNHSRSGRGVLRGLHYQTNPKAQGKLVRVLDGEIFDVAVDFRKGSPFFGRWAGMRMNARDMTMLYIPEGFAHGFYVMSESAEIEYWCTAVYSPENERGVHYADPTLGIKWPYDHEPLVSGKDSASPLLAFADNNYVYEK